MALLYLQGFEGFDSVGDRTDLDVEFDFNDSVGTTEAGITSGRTGGKAAFSTESSSTDTAELRLPVAGLSSEDTWIVGHAFFVRYNYFRRFTASPVLINFRDALDNVLINVYAQGGTIHVANGSGTLLGTANLSITTNVWHYLEVKVTFHASAGSVVLRLNEEEVLTLSTVNTVGSSSFTRPAQIGFGFSGDAVRGEVDDIYICDDTGSANNDFLGDIAVRRYNASGNGSNSDFVGSDGNSTDNYALVDESDPNTSDYVESSTPTNLDTYAFENIADNPAAIPGVAVKSYAQKTDAGSRTFVHFSMVGASTSVSPTIYPSAVTYRFLGSVFETQPSSSSAWTKTAFNSAEFGFRVES